MKIYEGFRVNYNGERIIFDSFGLKKSTSICNYEELSLFLNEQGYDTIRMVHNYDFRKFEYSVYKGEVEGIIDDLKKFNVSKGRLILLGHGFIGSTTAIGLANKEGVYGVITYGGAGITAIENVKEYAKHKHIKIERIVSCRYKPIDRQFFKDLYAIRVDEVTERLERLSKPLLFVNTSEDFIYYPKVVKRLREIKNSNIVIKDLFGMTNIWVECGLANATSGNVYAIRTDKVFTVCSRLKTTIRKWMDGDRIAAPKYTSEFAQTTKNVFKLIGKNVGMLFGLFFLLLFLMMIMTIITNIYIQNNGISFFDNGSNQEIIWEITKKY